MKPRKPIKRKTDRKKLMEKIDTMQLKILRIKRGAVCEICGKREDQLPYPLSRFHIKSRGEMPRIQYHEFNVLLACWAPYDNAKFCHNIWHHDPFSSPRLMARITVLRGDFWEDQLEYLNRTVPKLSTFQLGLIYEAHKQELEKLTEGRGHAGN